MRTIDADELTDKSEILYQHTPSGTIIPWSAVRVCVINNIKTIEAEPVQHGIPVAHYKTWCNSDGEPVITLPYGYKCPFCGDTDIKRFCPNCGAKMDGGA